METLPMCPNCGNNHKGDTAKKCSKCKEITCQRCSFTGCICGSMSTEKNYKIMALVLLCLAPFMFSCNEPTVTKDQANITQQTTIVDQAKEDSIRESIETADKLQALERKKNSLLTLVQGGWSGHYLPRYYSHFKMSLDNVVFDKEDLDKNVSTTTCSLVFDPENCDLKSDRYVLRLGNCSGNEGEAFTKGGVSFLIKLEKGVLSRFECNNGEAIKDL